MAAEEILRGEQAPRHGEDWLYPPTRKIGEGADHFDVEGFGCDYAYTVDGGQLGGLDYETFNAASAVVEVEGVSTHTGGAKGKMVNSMGVAMEFCALLPKGQVPELTEGREGFIHLDAIHGNVEHTVMQFLIPGPRQGAVPPEEGTDGESRRLYQRQVPHPAFGLDPEGQLLQHAGDD